MTTWGIRDVLILLTHERRTIYKNLQKWSSLRLPPMLKNQVNNMNINFKGESWVAYCYFCFCRQFSFSCKSFPYEAINCPCSMVSLVDLVSYFAPRGDVLSSEKDLIWEVDMDIPVQCSMGFQNDTFSYFGNPFQYSMENQNADFFLIYFFRFWNLVTM